MTLPQPITLTAKEWQSLREVQLAGLLKLDDVCGVLGLRYQLAAGTLLGAVRHGGFVPWDDDVDVALLRADYDRLLREAPALLGPDWFLQHHGSDPGYHKMHAKLRRNGSLFIEQGAAHRQHHHGIYIDIFPFDAVLPNHLLGQPYLRAAAWAHAAQELIDGMGDEGPPFARWFRRLGQRIPEQVRTEAHEALLRVPARLGASERVACLATYPLDRKKAARLPRPLVEVQELVRLPFEGHLLAAPARFDAILRRLYGDYMRLPREAERRPKHGVVGFSVEGRWTKEGVTDTSTESSSAS